MGTGFPEIGNAREEAHFGGIMETVLHMLGLGSIRHPDGRIQSRV